MKKKHLPKCIKLPHIWSYVIHNLTLTRVKIHLIYETTMPTKVDQVASVMKQNKNGPYSSVYEAHLAPVGSRTLTKHIFVWGIFLLDHVLSQSLILSQILWCKYKESLCLIYLDHSKELPSYISCNTSEVLLISADINSSEPTPPIN